MNNSVILMISFCIGAALGAFFFGGLWWTVLKGIHTRNPGLLFGLSLVLRTAVTLAGFVLTFQGHFDRLTTCLAGFFTARWLVLRLTRQALNRPLGSGKEAEDETES